MLTNPPARGAQAALLAAVALLGASCQIPSFEEGPQPTTSPSRLGASPVDPAAPAVVETVEELRRHVQGVIDALAAAIDSADVGEQRAAAAAGSRALTADEAFGVGAEPVPRPFLPGPAVAREEVIDWNDLFTDALRAGREVGGDRLLAVLSDPIAGDLGAWQRDPAGVYDAVAEVLDDATTDLEATEQLVAARLDGQALRALAWTELASTASSNVQATALLERAIAHLSIIREALDTVAADIDAES